MLDSFDTRLLEALQSQAQATAAELAGRVPLSASQISRRRARLEAQGIVTGYRATLAPEKVGLAVEAFIQVSMAAHTVENAERFRALCRATPAIIGAWTLTGEADYLLRVFCPDLPALNRLVQDVLLTQGAVARVHSQIVLDRVKPDAPLPIPTGA